MVLQFYNFVPMGTWAQTGPQLESDEEATGETSLYSRPFQLLEYPPLCQVYDWGNLPLLQTIPQTRLTVVKDCDSQCITMMMKHELKDLLLLIMLWQIER